MKSYMDSGGWIVTAPVYAGDEAAVLAAAGCGHEWVASGNRQVRDGVEMVMKRCARCVAARCRWRPVDATP